MDSKEIKRLAKQKIKGNKWNILWPMLTIICVLVIIILLLFTFFGVDLNNISIPLVILFLATIFIFNIFVAGYNKYTLNFIRTGKFDLRYIIYTFKEKWFQILLYSIIMVLSVVFFSIFLIIPGIVIALSYQFALDLLIDSESNGIEVLNMSKAMMKGYKLDFFVFQLSFIGWILVGILTLGIGMIWIYPYIVVSVDLYYEKLRERDFMNIGSDLDENSRSISEVITRNKIGDE